jgi:bifunctional DNA-binding transcriptional regulator/antitoxin component of YhaV-PrlF toxin-antitoxin module
MQPRSRSFKSKVHRILKGSTSLRTVIPQGVAVVLGLEAGDTLEWKAEVGRLSIVVTRQLEPVAEPRRRP